MYTQYEWISLCCGDEVVLYTNTRIKQEVGVCQCCKKFCSYEENEDYGGWPESPYADEPEGM